MHTITWLNVVATTVISTISISPHISPLVSINNHDNYVGHNNRGQSPIYEELIGDCPPLSYPFVLILFIKDAPWK